MRPHAADMAVWTAVRHVPLWTRPRNRRAGCLCARGRGGRGEEKRMVGEGRAPLDARPHDSGRTDGCGQGQ